MNPRLAKSISPRHAARAARVFNQMSFDDLTIAEKVMVRVCQATAPSSRCACWDGSQRRRRPACQSLDGVVSRIVDDVRRDVYRTIEERKS